MRHFLITKNGVARVMTCRDDTDGAAEVAKWHPDDQAQVTAIREISEADIPAEADHYLRDGWEDDGGKIVVNMIKARASFNKAVRTAKLAKARELQLREDIGEDVTAERAALTVTPDLAGADTPAKLKALWPSAR
jgi:hypothetical protein